MANDFNKEERVAFEQLLEGFQDAEVMSRNVAKYQTDQTMMERSQDTIWRRQPYVMNSFDGTDMSSNFNDKTQMAVPASINIEKSVPWILTQTELRDALQDNSLGDSAKQKLASDINQSVLDVASNQGTLVVPIAAAATGFDDVAEIEAIMNEQGVMGNERVLAISTRDYNGMAGNLAERDFFSDKVKKAYEKAYVGEIASFSTWKLDYSRQLPAASGGGSLTIDTTDDSSQFYLPTAVTTSPTTSERLNVDNRTQSVTISSTTSVVAGDAFTIANLFAVHHITKVSTGQLKTFRVISVTSGTVLVISPPIIDPSSDVNGEAAVQYQNCTREGGAGSATAAIVFLNIDAARMNPFWQKDAIEILPGRYVVPTNAGASVMKGSTDSGIELCMTKQFDINTYKTKYRLDTRYGVVNKAPEMSGILLFSQIP
jgi:hypothetical protein